MHSNERPWPYQADGLTLAVRLTPKGGRDTIDGIERLADGRGVLKVRVRAAASEGEANAALIRLHRHGARRADARRQPGGGRNGAAQAAEDRGAGVTLAAALEKICAIG